MIRLALVLLGTALATAALAADIPPAAQKPADPPAATPKRADVKIGKFTMSGDMIDKLMDGWVLRLDGTEVKEANDMKAEIEKGKTAAVELGQCRQQLGQVRKFLTRAGAESAGIAAAIDTTPGQ